MLSRSVGYTAGISADDALARASEGLALIKEGLAVLAEVDLDALDRSARLTLSKEMAADRTRLEALRSDVLAQVVEKKDWEGGPTRTPQEYERQVSGEPIDKARETIRRAQDLHEDLPLFRQAYRNGQITADYIDAVRRVIGHPALKRQLAELVDGEAALLDDALQMTADRFRRRVKAWAVKYTPVEEEREARKEKRQKKLHLFEKDGGWVLSGWLPHVDGEVVNTVLGSSMGRRAEGDDRLPPERRAEALVDVCVKATQTGQISSGARVTPHLLALVDLESLLTAEARARLAGELPAAGTHGIDHPVLGKLKATISAGIAAKHFTGLEPATLEDGTPLTPAQLQMTMCDSQISRIVMDGQSRVLDVGRSSRTCTPAQTLAVITRDRTCQFPGCDQRYASSHIHHANHWENGGSTDLDNLIMLCWHHHAKVHDEAITIHRYDGGVRFINRFGKEIANPNDHRGDLHRDGSDDQRSPRDFDQGCTVPENGRGRLQQLELLQQDSADSPGVLRPGLLSPRGLGHVGSMAS